MKRRRRALDLTQAELASQVGCAAATIRKIEAEERRPSAQIAERLAVIFNIPPEERTAFLRFARRGGRAAPLDTKGDLLWQVSTRTPRSNLPAPITTLIGREQEIAEVCDYLLRADVRLVTLIGPPGVGKTRLSIEAARAILPDFPDGVFFVALAPLEDASLLARTIAQTLEYIERKNQPASEQLIEGIGDQQMLLVLDNCEHLIDGVVVLAARLLSACSRLKILATSRESLRISGEWICAVPPLSAPKESSLVNMKMASEFPALALFTERAHAVHPSFVLHLDNIRAVASICRQLDGLPLAIELIAARIRLMSPQVLLEGLSDQLILSADGMRSLSERQKTLNNAIGWSYQLLSEEEQKIFTRLSVFSGSFTLKEAEEILPLPVAEKPIADLIASLLDKSLLQRIPDEQGEPRFSMLVTIQQFAREHLRRRKEQIQFKNRHLAYFREVTENAPHELRGPNQLQGLHRLHLMRDNLRAALAWAIETRQTQVALRMVNSLSLFWFRRSDLSEERRWLERITALPDAPQYPKLYSYALAQLAHATWLQIGPKEARPSVEQALAVARAHEDEWNIAWGLTVLGLILIHEENFADAQAILEESKALFREVGDEWGYANAVISMALGAYIQGAANTLALHEEALTLFRTLGDLYFEGVALRFIGLLQSRQDDVTDGIASLQEALILAKQLDSKYEIAAVLYCCGEAAQRSGNPARAVSLYWASKNVAISIGAWRTKDESDFENDLAPCRALLGESNFAQAVAEGRAMMMEQAIDYALENQEL